LATEYQQKNLSAKFEIVSQIEVRLKKQKGGSAAQSLPWSVAANVENP